MNLKHAPDHVKDDFEFILDNVTKCPRALKYASHRLRNNKTIALNVITIDGQLISILSDDLKKDKDIIVLSAVR